MANSQVRTTAGTTLGISAGSPATYTVADFSTLTYTQVGEISDIGSFGKKSNLVTFSPISSRSTAKRKGSANNGTLSLKMGSAPTDAGQVIMQSGLNSDTSYVFKVTTQAGNAYYFTGQVMSFVLELGSVDQIMGASADIEIDNDILFQAYGDTTVYYARSVAALASVLAGTGYFKMGLLGDSTMAGAKAGTSGGVTRSITPVTLLRDNLNSLQGLPAIASNWIGDQRFQVTNAISPYAFDTRLTNPEGNGFIATSGATPVSVGGSLLNNSANASRLGFLPEVATDTTDIYYPVNTTLGAFSVIRNGGTSLSVNQVGASGMGKATYTSPLNSVDPIYLSRTTGGAYVIGMDSYNSAIKSIRLFGLGWSGGRAADWAATTTGFDPLNGLLALNLDLVVIRFGTNDISVPGATTTSTDPVAYQASINKILDALKAAGTNVIIATHYPMNTSVSSQALQDTYAGYVRSIAAARHITLHDTYARVGTWAAANAAGKMYDNLHPNAAGYNDDAAALANLVLTLAPVTPPVAPVTASKAIGSSAIGSTAI